MQITLKAYQTELVKEDNAYNSTELKDTYTSIRIGSNIRKSNTDANSQVDGVLFLAETLKEEVLQGTPKQQKKNLKQLKKLFIQFATIATMVGVGTTYGMITAEPITASASSLFPVVANDVPTTEITPDGIMQWAYKIALLVTSIGVGLAMSMIAVVGIYMMLTRKTEKAIAWNSDIIKGLVQVIVSIPLIWALFQLSQIVFKNLLYLEALTPK